MGGLTEPMLGKMDLKRDEFSTSMDSVDAHGMHGGDYESISFLGDEEEGGNFKSEA